MTEASANIDREKTPEQLCQERAKRLVDAIHLRQPDRVPISLGFGNLLAEIGGITRQELCESADLALTALEKAAVRYQPDIVADLYVYAVLLGVGSGLSMVCMMTIPANYFGTKAYPSIIGLVMAVGTTSAAIAPVVAGHFYDTTRSYGAAFYSIAVVCLASSLLVLGVTPPPRRVRACACLAGKQAVAAPAE